MALCWHLHLAAETSNRTPLSDAATTGEGPVGSPSTPLPCRSEETFRSTTQQEGNVLFNIYALNINATNATQRSGLQNCEFSLWQIFSYDTIITYAVISYIPLVQ